MTQQVERTESSVLRVAGPKEKAVLKELHRGVVDGDRTALDALHILAFEDDARWTAERDGRFTEHLSPEARAAVERLSRAEAVLPGASPLNGPEATTRDEAAHRAHAKAVERMRAVERELIGALQELERAQTLMKEIGVQAVYEFKEPVAAAYSKWLEGRVAEGA